VATARLDPEAFELQVGPERFYVTEAERREDYGRFLAEGFQRDPRLRTRAGDTLHFRGEPLGAFRSASLSVGGDTSNLLLRMNTSRLEVVVKSYKLLDPNNREPVILERLYRRRFPYVPRYLGEVSLGRGEERLVLGIATEWLEADDLFTWLTQGWHDEIGRGHAAGNFEEASLDLAGALGDATASLHDALVDRKPGPFHAELFEPEDMQSAFRLATSNLTEALRMLGRHAQGEGPIPSDLADRSRGLLLENRRAIEDVLVSLEASVGTAKTVTHGDLHLGQVLRSKREGALVFIDFEGEPERVPGLRSVKLPPLRDAATMNRSFAYVTHTAWRDFLGGDSNATWKLMNREDVPPEGRDYFRRLQQWEEAARDGFTQRYLAHVTLYPELDVETALRAIRGWMMEKALYELRYELKHRPTRFLIPLDGILSLANRGA
jgi:maltose alpha-D-glucosyltransferase/alpha-amylase